MSLKILAVATLLSLSAASVSFASPVHSVGPPALTPQTIEQRCAKVADDVMHKLDPTDGPDDGSFGEFRDGKMVRMSKSEAHQAAKEDCLQDFKEKAPSISEPTQQAPPVLGTKT